MRKLGLQNFTLVLIEDYSCSNKEQLLHRERYIFDLHDKQILLNKNRPYTTCVEKRQQHVKYSRKWNINNELYYKQYQKTYKQNNKLQMRAYSLKYKEHQRLMQELPFYRVP